MTTHNNNITYNDKGAFYATGAGEATIYVYDVSTSLHAAGAINVTVAGDKKSTSSDEEKNKDEKKKDETSSSTSGTYTIDGSTYVKFGSDMILKKAATTKTSMTVNTVTISGKKYKVVAIADSAFKDNIKLKKVTIGANVQSIGQTAFLRCKNLKTVTIKSKKLTKNSTVGKNAFKTINKKATIKVVSSAFTKTKKVLTKKAGIAKTVKIKKLS
ncbi:MAG: leucine-rich repeat domain-containing protein [Lachnospiraceae bacterium]|nr:leucine-rich repeat domain-containing protein [Lachnospiraceae bacterium]